jgi:sulfide:quinone oxidoreductase
VTYVTPLDGAFTKPLAGAELGGMFDERGIELEPDFMLEQVDLDEQCWSATTSARCPSTCS